MDIDHHDEGEIISPYHAAPSTAMMSGLKDRVPSKLRTVYLSADIQCFVPVSRPRHQST
jgi:hypothetical protein